MCGFPAYTEISRTDSSSLYDEMRMWCGEQIGD
jgi:hypothetical protein